MTSTFHGSSQDIKRNELCAMREKNVKIKKISGHFSFWEPSGRERNIRVKTKLKFMMASKRTEKKLLMSFHPLVIESFLTKKLSPSSKWLYKNFFILTASWELSQLSCVSFRIKKILIRKGWKKFVLMPFRSPIFYTSSILKSFLVESFFTFIFLDEKISSNLCCQKTIWKEGKWEKKTEGCCACVDVENIFNTQKCFCLFVPSLDCINVFIYLNIESSNYS
jgi:hypothetical protein